MGQFSVAGVGQFYIAANTFLVKGEIDMEPRTPGRKGLSKSRLIAWRQCPKRLWLAQYRPELAAESAATTRIMSLGTEVGEVARELHPGGILVEGEDLGVALQETRRLLQEAPAKPLFEATFEHQGVLVRVDLLLPEADGYRLVEVKSSTGVKEYHHADLAIQVWVLRELGVPLTNACIAHIDNSFIYPGNRDYRGLLREVVLTDEITPLLDETRGNYA